jgi:hypothetical protein
VCVWVRACELGFTVEAHSWACWHHKQIPLDGECVYKHKHSCVCVCVCVCVSEGSAGLILLYLSEQLKEKALHFEMAFTVIYCAHTNASKHTLSIPIECHGLTGAWGSSIQHSSFCTTVLHRPAEWPISAWVCSHAVCVTSFSLNHFVCVCVHCGGLFYPCEFVLAWWLAPFPSLLQWYIFLHLTWPSESNGFWEADLPENIDIKWFDCAVKGDG